MISRFAEGECETMMDEGLRPTFADIIRLNAIGCKVDHGEGDADLYRLRRVAVVDGVAIREPTIAHVLFVAELASVGYDVDDFVTGTLCRAWAFSLRDDEIPDSISADEASERIYAFVKSHLMRVTFTRLRMALNYVVFGYDSTALERAATPNDESEMKTEDRTADESSIDDAWNFDIGVLHMGEVVRLGIPLKDARKHTQAEMQIIVRMAVDRQMSAAHGNAAVKKAKHERFVAEFYATLAEIRTRLQKEKEMANG